MKTALLLISKTDDFLINYQIYLAACIERVIKSGYMPLTPAVYKTYTELNKQEYINRILPITDIVFLFVDFGIDTLMIETTAKCNNAKVEIKTERFTQTELDELFNSPNYILRDVSNKMNIEMESLKRKTRKREIVDARYIYFRRAKEKTKATLASIGLLVGQDHATVLAGIKKATTDDSTLVKKYQSVYPINNSKVKC